MNRGKADRKKDTESQGGQPDAGLELMKSLDMTWVEPKSQMLNQVIHPGTPYSLGEQHQ